MSEKTILVSACLLGTPCRYDGKSKPHRLVQAFLKASHARVIPICPEVMGGLLTPRPPAEIQPDGRVRTQSGLDVTDAYDQGAEKVLHLAQKEGADLVILQAKSPSCGVFIPLRWLLYENPCKGAWHYGAPLKGPWPPAFGAAGS